ncbi:hypothetical protein GWA97_08640 [Flavobacterium sp. LaA7.5]|nr:hypothetical protein [Flavobacterium salilacus subsp. altitudinum]
MNTVEEGKTMAIVSYITIFGTIIAMVMNSEKKNYFTSFHIRQALGVILTFFILGYPVGLFDSWMVSSAFYIFFFILWIYGFLGAVQGQMNLIPVLGSFFQKTFKSL